ncbi:MAG: PAS domain S-box protein, partial [Proteobacteria bacterium]|nr:PAS domain S-box protein [Pseudomonadota bacterium]
MNETHRQQSGFEVGILGLFYRVTQPLFLDNEYIGVVEFGLKVDQLLKPLHKGSSDNIAVLINREHYSKAVLVNDETYKSCGPYVLLPQGNNFFQKISPEALDCTSDSFQVSLDGHSYHVSQDMNLKDYQGNSIGKIIIAHDITDQKDKLQGIVKVSALTSIALLAVALSFLYFSIGTFLNRIFKLNQSLAQMNDGLESTVRERTAELEHEVMERKQATLELEQEINHRQEAEKKLAQEKELLTITLRSIGDGVISTNLQGDIILLNNNAEQLTGWSHQEALGRPLQEIFHIANEDNGVPQENIVENIAENGNIRQLDNHTVLIARDGGKIHITASVAPIYNRERHLIGVIAVFRDVTARKRLEEEILKVQKLESVGILAGGIAHDFNNLLSAILGNVNLAREIIGPHHEIRDLLLRAEKASLRARDLTRQLLTFARGGAPVKQTASINELIKDSVDFILSGSKVKCTYQFAPDLRPLQFDAGLMSQVMQNIILNSCQAMGNQGSIAISTENIDQTMSASWDLPPADYVQISIMDSGKGIETQNLARIFDPYFSTKEKSSEKGSGLGLAIVHSIITQHGGLIRADSKVGSGTTFTILLPAAAGEPAAMPGQTEAGDISKGIGNILVMDDEEVILEVAETM